MKEPYDKFKDLMERHPDMKEYFEEFQVLEDMGLMEKVVDPEDKTQSGRPVIYWMPTKKGNKIARLLNHIGAR